METVSMKVIARIRTDFPTKFGIPRQSGLVEALRGRVIFEEEFRNPDALRGVEGFSHLWLIWGFSQTAREEWSPTVRPPRLGGNERLGVFATRSPFRPNPIGLSCVRLEGVELHGGEGPVLLVSGADLMDGTPIFDIKPYLPYVDCREEATGGFAASKPEGLLKVEDPDELLLQVKAELRDGLAGVLACDPRPAYQKDPKRVYGMDFGGYSIQFNVEGDRLMIRKVAPLAEEKGHE